MVWGKPLKEQKDQEDPDDTQDMENPNYFPVCHLFDISQVAPIQAKAN